MTHAEELVVLALFACWLVLCLAVYLPSVNTTIRRLDHMALIPEWRFFAPNPGRHDFHLLYRDKFGDGTLTAWTEVAPITPRRATSLLLNPDRRRNKALFDCTQEFAKHVEARDRALELSIPYLTLLNYVSCLPRSPSPRWTQFLLMWSAGDPSDKDPEVLFVSGLHEL